MMKQQMQRIMRPVGTAAAFITRPVVRGMGWVWAASPLGQLWATLPPKAKRAVKVFSITFWLCWFAGAAWAAGGGIASVFPARPGQTLANALDPFVFWQDKTAEPPGNVPADVMIGLAGMVFIAVASFAWVISWLMTGMIGGSSAFEDAFDISPMLSSAMGELAGWLLPSCLAMGACVTYFDVMRQKSNTANGLISFFTIGIISLGLLISPASFVGGLNMGRDIGQKVVSTVVSSSPVSSKEPFEWETNYSAENNTKSFALQVQDAYWRTFIVTPWCIGEFGGDMGLCRQHGAEVLKKSKYDERHSYYEKQIIDKQGDNQHLQKILKGDDWSGRVGLVLFGALIALIGSILVGLLVFNALVAWFQAVLLLFLGVFFLPLGIIPGVTRSWLVNWATRLVGAVVVNALMMLLLVSTMGIIAGISTSNAEWNQQLITEIFVLFAAFGLKGVVQQMVNSAGAGSGGVSQLIMIRAMSRTGHLSRRAASGAASRVGQAVRSRAPRRAAIGRERTGTHA